MVNRAALSAIGSAANDRLDVILGDINTAFTSVKDDLISPLEVTASGPASLIIHVNSSLINNPINNKSRSASFITNLIPQFVSGTVTFPSASGGNITTSTGGSILLTLPSNQYVQVLLELDTDNKLITVVGTPNAVLANAVVPGPTGTTIPFAYVTLFNNAGTISNITQSNIVQLIMGGGSNSLLGLITQNNSDGNKEVLVGTSLFIPYLTIEPSDTYTVDIGAQLVSVDAVTVLGNLIINGISKVL